MSLYAGLDIEEKSSTVATSKADVCKLLGNI